MSRVAVDGAAGVRSSIDEIEFTAALPDSLIDAVAMGRRTRSPARRRDWGTSVTLSVAATFTSLISWPVQTNGGINIRSASNCRGERG
jgi:hypothetical protein